MKNFDAVNHIKGKSLYIDDYPIPEGTLHAVVFDSTIAHGNIKNLNLENAEKLNCNKQVVNDSKEKNFFWKNIP